MKIESEIKRKTQNFGNFYRNRKNEKTDLGDSLFGVDSSRDR